jgi:zinc protease
VDDLGITEIAFGNGVRVNLKRTPFEANQIRIHLRVGAGRLIEPRAEPGLGFFTDLSFEAGGLGKHSADELQRIFAGRTLSVEFKVGDDALEFAANTNRQDLELQLELLAAELADPGYRPEALRLARKETNEYFDELDHSIEGPLETGIPRLLSSGDSRFGLPQRAEATARTLVEEKAWLEPQLSSGPVEVGVVGDIDPDATIAALARTLGALPVRSAKPAYVAEREGLFPSSALAREIAVPTEIPKAVVALYWPTTDARDIGRTRRLRLLSNVFGDRLRVKVREQLGGTYAPEAVSEPSETFTDYGFLVAETVVAPERAAEIRNAVLAIADDLQRNGVTADELERARRPLLTAVRESVRSNAYWLGAVLANCQEFPQRLDWARTREADLVAVTAAEVDALARRYLTPDRAFQFTILPARK